METPATPLHKHMPARFAGRCARSNQPFSAGAEIAYDSQRKTACKLVGIYPGAPASIDKHGHPVFEFVKGVFDKWYAIASRQNPYLIPFLPYPITFNLPVRIQRRRTKGWRLPKGAKCVTRPGKWGNPLKLIGGALYVDVGYRRQQLARSYWCCP